MHGDYIICKATSHSNRTCVTVHDQASVAHHSGCTAVDRGGWRSGRHQRHEWPPRVCQ